MRKLRFESIGKPVSDVDINSAEMLTGLKLPDLLKQFFLSTCGGRPIECLYECGETQYIVSEFLPLISGNYSAVDVYNHLVITEKLIPTRFFPIAFDPGGDDIWVDTANSSCTMYLYRHDTYFESERFVNLGVSLDIFLKSLKTP